MVSRSLCWPKAGGWAFLFAAMCGRLFAEEAESQIRVARLIERLSSGSYTDRAGASDELATLAADAREQLLAATTSDDPEVRLRARRLLRQLGEDGLWLASLVDCRFKKVAASEALAAVSRQSGNRLLIGDAYGTFRDKELALDLDLKGVPFWRAVDQLCRLTGNRVRPHFDTRNPGLVVVAGIAGKHPVAYAGPVRLQVNRARRLFSEELDYEQHSSEKAHSFQFDLQAVWEDRFRLVAYRLQPELIEAVTDTGIRLSGQSTTGGWNIAGPSTKQVSMNLRIQPPSTTATCLKTLRLKWGLIAAGDMAQLEIDRLDSTEPHFQDDIELVVEKVQDFPGSRCELSLRIVSDGVVSDPADLIFCENEVELLDAQGRAYRRQGQTNTIAGDSALMRISFLGDEGHTGPKKLRFHYSRIRSQRELEIVFRDVPLPVGRPE
ncbi:MAG TPA: hypothetical protein VG125_30285 [Pirellulales bacterium]|jgi:hypothetical protein|nr:hypothetical protein [Pirellulales bacterium]